MSAHVQHDVSRVKMASEIVSNVRIAEVQLNSFIRGYHAYTDVWTPFIGEELLLRREPDNVKDSSAVSVVKEGEIVGHIPFNISNVVSHFLRRDINKGFAIVTGDKVNRGAGYGLKYDVYTGFMGQNLSLRSWSSFLFHIVDKTYCEHFCLVIIIIKKE